MEAIVPITPVNPVVPVPIPDTNQPPVPVEPPPPPTTTETCEQAAARLEQQKQTLIGHMNGALENINQIIAAAESQAAMYPLGSPCQVMFADFAQRFKDKRDALESQFDDGMNTLMVVDCSSPDWRDQVQSIDLFQGQMQNLVDAMNQLYRDARQKKTGVCEDFDDYEPDPNLCSMLKSDTDALIAATSTKLEELCTLAHQKMEATTDPEARSNWLNTRTIYRELKNCFESNIPADVSCSHKEWEARLRARLGAVQMMFNMATCMKAQGFPDN